MQVFINVMKIRKIFVGNPAIKRRVVNIRHRSEDSVKMGLRKEVIRA